MDIRKSFGKAVRKSREKIGLTQEKLAEKTGLHRTYIGDIERGVRNPALVNIFKISNALGIRVNELFEIEKEIRENSGNL